MYTHCCIITCMQTIYTNYCMWTKSLHATCCMYYCKQIFARNLFHIIACWVQIGWQRILGLFLKLLPAYQNSAQISKSITNTDQSVYNFFFYHKTRTRQKPRLSMSVCPGFVYEFLSPVFCVWVPVSGFQCLGFCVRVPTHLHSAILALRMLEGGVPFINMRIRTCKNVYMYTCTHVYVCTCILYTAICIWSVISSVSYLNRWSRFLCQSLFCHDLLTRNRWDWDWRLRLNHTLNAIRCTFIAKAHLQWNIRFYESWFIFEVGLSISRTNADSQWNPVYKAFRQIRLFGNEPIRQY